MSKIIDVLNKRFKSRDTIVDSVQEELAKTFFASTTKKDKKKTEKPKTSKVPWIIAFISLSLVFLVILFRNHIDIHLRITNNFPPATQKGIFFIKEGELNKYLIRDTYFFGDARKFSRKRDDMLVLVNSKGSGWANFSIELKEPMDMKELGISYTAKGQVGDEYLVLVLVDRENKSYRMVKDLSSRLTRDWQEYSVSLKPIRNSIDLANVSKIRFEFGSLTSNNHPFATIFVKDIYVRKARGAKWL